MSKAAPDNATQSFSTPVWVEEPFRLFFRLGLLAAVFGLLLWPLHYGGWWETYPVIQHPRIMILGFGSAFIIGFLGTAWPRFVEAPPMRLWEVGVLAFLWTAGQILYATGPIWAGDLTMAVVLTFFLVILGIRIFGKGREWPPPGFLIAFLGIGMGADVLICWAFGIGASSVSMDALFRLIVYQGLLLLPLMGVGSILFGRIFPFEKKAPPARPILFIASGCGLVLVSFFIEVWGTVASGNLVRAFAMVVWARGAVPVLLGEPAPGTRPWALRVGMLMIVAGFGLKAVFPDLRWVFAFEHLLFLGGFSQLMLLVADRVATGHSVGVEDVNPRSVRWRWIVWLMVFTALTRATADIVPSTRVSHHIYAALMLVIIIVLWWIDNGRRLK